MQRPTTVFNFCPGEEAVAVGVCAALATRRPAALQRTLDRTCAGARPRPRRGHGRVARQGCRAVRRPRRPRTSRPAVSGFLRRARRCRRQPDHRRRRGTRGATPAAPGRSSRASSGMARAAPARCTKRSTSPHCGSCRWCSSATTTTTRSRPRGPKRWRRSYCRTSPSRSAFLQRQSTAWTSSSCAMPHARVRSAHAQGQGPSFLECHLIAIRHALDGDPRNALRTEELAAWSARCPIETFAMRLQGEGMLSAELRGELERGAEKPLSQSALATAEASPYPAPSDLLRDVI